MTTLTLNLDVQLRIMRNGNQMRAALPIAVQLDRDAFMKTILDEVQKMMPEVTEPDVTIRWINAKDVIILDDDETDAED